MQAEAATRLGGPLCLAPCQPASSVLTADKASQSLGVQHSLAQSPQTDALVIAVSPASLCPLPLHPSAIASPTRYPPGANYPPWPALPSHTR